MKTDVRILIGLAALLAAALAALVFPDMKKLLLLIPFALVALGVFSGCSSNRFERALRNFPEGKADKVTLGHTNLGIGTTITAEKFDNHDDVLKAGRISFTHNDPWTGQTTIAIENAEIDVAQHRPAKKTGAPEIPLPPAASNTGPR